MKKENLSASQEYGRKYVRPQIKLALPQELWSVYYEDLEEAFFRGYNIKEIEVHGKRVITVEDTEDFGCDKCVFAKFCAKISEHLSLVGEVPCRRVDGSYGRYFKAAPPL